MAYSMIQVEVTGDKLTGWGEAELSNYRTQAYPVVRKARNMVIQRIAQKLETRGQPAIGQPPRLRSGDLLAALKPAGDSISAAAIVAGLKVDHPGANRLEFGGRDRKGRITFPHPYVRPAFEELTPEIEQMLVTL